MFYVLEDTDFLLMNTQGRVLLLHTGAVSAKATRFYTGRAGDDAEEKCPPEGGQGLP